MTKSVLYPSLLALVVANLINLTSAMADDTLFAMPPSSYLGKNLDGLKQLRTQQSKFLKSKGFASKSASEQRAMREQHEKLSRFINISESMDRCLSMTADNRQIKTQILAGAAALDPCFAFNLTGRDKNNSFDKNISGVKAALQASTQRAFKDNIRMMGLVHAGTSLLKYGHQFPDSKELPKTVEEAITEVCGGKCPNEDRAFLETHFNIAKAQIEDAIGRQNLPTYTAKSAGEEVNKRIQDLNLQLREVANLKKDSSEGEDQAYSQYDLYTKKYVHYTTDTLGSLIFKSDIQSKMGKIRNFDEINSRTVGGSRKKYIEGEHSPLIATCAGGRHNCKEKSVAALISSALIKVRGDVRRYIQDSQKPQSLDEMVKTSPIAVGQALMNLPEQTGSVCQVIAEIDQADAKNKHLWSTAESIMTAIDAASLGLVAVGGAGLFVKGISTLASQGVKRLGKAGIVAGAAMAATRGGIGAAGFQHFGSEKEQMIKARMAQVQTPDQYDRMIEIEDNIERAKDHLMESGLSLVGFGGAGVASSLRASGTLGRLLGKQGDFASQLNADAKYAGILTKLSSKEHRAAVAKLQKGREKGLYTGDDIEVLLSSLVGRSDSEIDDMFKLMSSSRVGDSELKKAIQTANEEVSKCLLGT
ncbi:MAG: hypothetical protein H6626_10415 [Pseudobdellovibrionaceae bacterium]|nr:MAG: hypothetical protein H6626_10415 [Pseudobdellovibrionaceae bacterium]